MELFVSDILRKTPLPLPEDHEDPDQVEPRLPRGGEGPEGDVGTSAEIPAPPPGRPLPLL